MLKKQPEVKNEHKRLSIISDIIIFLFIVFVSVGLIEKLDIFSYKENITGKDEVADVISLVNTEVDEKKLIEQENNLIIKNIKDKYGISVLYSSDVKNFASRLDAVEQNDIYIVNNNLKIIEKSLEKYPISTFYMSISKTNPIYIMLVDNFSNDNIALASRNSLNEYRMYISNTEKFERAFHHEMYHILEYFMASNNENIYYSWNDLNPENFEYNENVSTLTDEYVFDKNKGQDNNIYFITKYSKTTQREDRAEIFAELMLLNNTPSYLMYGKNIRKKVDLIQNTISENVTKSDFYFDKYVN